MRFYFTTHPGDLYRARIHHRRHLMLVATPHWDAGKGRLRVRRPPADRTASVAVDGGGFTAARKWGVYPWTIEQYTDWIDATVEDVTLDFCVPLDYACEPGVKRDTYATNVQRIEATLENEQACRSARPDLPWIAVLQGDSLDERAYDLQRRRELGMLPAPGDLVGLGSICGRGILAAREVIVWYATQLPRCSFHPFGVHVQALDDPLTRSVVSSWDSYTWNWGKGQKDVDRPEEYLKRPGEGHASHCRRLADLYWVNTVLPRLQAGRADLQISLFEGSPPGTQEAP